MEASAMSRNELMLSPAVLLEAMQSKARVRCRLQTLIQAQAEQSRDTVEPVDTGEYEVQPSLKCPAACEGLLACN
ncbi:MAG: hypothetical protein MK085_01340 [Phycisphaerales bacterium]|nr:hypothetical protein [Phycisphaerales bacterium]